MFSFLCHSPRADTFDDDDGYGTNSSTSNSSKPSRKPTKKQPPKVQTAYTYRKSRDVIREISSPSGFRHEFHLGPDVGQTGQVDRGAWDTERWRQEIETRWQTQLPKAQAVSLPAPAHVPASPTPKAQKRTSLIPPQKRKPVPTLEDLDNLPTTPRRDSVEEDRTPIERPSLDSTPPTQRSSTEVSSDAETPSESESGEASESSESSGPSTPKEDFLTLPAAVVAPEPERPHTTLLGVTELELKTTAEVVDDAPKSDIPKGPLPVVDAIPLSDTPLSLSASPEQPFPPTTTIVATSS